MKLCNVDLLEIYNFLEICNRSF